MDGIGPNAVSPVVPPIERLPRRTRDGTVDALRVTTLVTLGLVLVLISLGGAVRATDSGLACPDWPLCYGKVVPRQADIPDGSGYTLWNVWLEHSHRLVASVVGVLIIVLAVWVGRARYRPAGVRAPILVALVAVIAQGILGALVVLHLLHGELVTAHLGMSMVVVACLVTAVARLGRSSGAGSDRPRGALLVAGLVFTQMLVGSQVTGQRASLAYGLDPLRFHGELVPVSVATIPEAYHLAHRLLAYVTAAAVLAIAVGLWRRSTGPGRTPSDVSSKAPRLLATLLVLLVLVQIGLGFANIWYLTPPALITVHLTVASWIWAATVALVVWSRGEQEVVSRARRAPPTPIGSHQPDRTPARVPDHAPVGAARSPRAMR